MAGNPPNKPRTSLPWVLAYSAAASVMTGFVQHGVFFLATDQLGYDDTTNLWLALILFIPYVPGALVAGGAAKIVGARRLLVGLVLLMAACLVALSLRPDGRALWIVAPLYNGAAGMQWPIVESFIASGRHGRAMRRAIGWFNVVWAGTIALGLYVVSFMTGADAVVRWFIILAVMHVLMLLTTIGWGAAPAPHDETTGRSHVGDEYPQLLLSARILLPLSYLLMYALAPLMPGVWSRAGVTVSIGAALTSTWMISRFVVFFTMFIRPEWHGRWGILLAGAMTMVCGYATALLGPHPAVIIAGLAAYGIGQGMIYYAALYYGMAVGHGQVESGGWHEAVIGMGYAAGPIAGLLGRVATPDNPQTGILGAVILCVIVASVAAWRPYSVARKKRRD